MEQVQCDHCHFEVLRPLQPSGAGPIPDGWVAVIRRYTVNGPDGEDRRKVDNIYCGPTCAIAALNDVRNEARARQ